MIEWELKEIEMKGKLIMGIDIELYDRHLKIYKPEIVVLFLYF